ncbi:hypothetical protein EV127DRAFT_486331 [Xylaria flabelliformis]|nr:hypothetical protein EV127DRAFT_486331 [Xylaria flabelliformis]
MKWSTLISFVAIAMTPATALPAGVDVLDVRQGPASGCYPFEDPGCCINYAVCQCANGWFYQYNQAQNGCDPPWGILSQNGVSGLPGACC